MSIETFVYDTPHALFHSSFLTRIQTQAAGRRTLIISANMHHARQLKHQIATAQVANTSVMTLQAFLIRQLNYIRPHKVLNATSRAMVVEQAWQRANGAMWHRYGTNRGALQEIGMLLSWISSHRRQWRHVSDEIDQHHELGAIYGHYTHMLDQLNAIAYDDVALHVLDQPLPPLEYEYLVACELHNAQPAQLAVLARYAVNYPMWLGGWVSHPDSIPEQRTLATWLAQFAPIATWSTPDSTGTQLVKRLTGDAHSTPTFWMVGNRDSTQLPWIAGAATIVDECQAVAAFCHQQLLHGHAVHVVCADESLIHHIRSAIIQQGVALPPLAPPNYINPIINLARIALRWITSTDEDEQLRLIQRILTLPFIGVAASEARQICNDVDHPTHRAIRTWLTQIDPTHAIAPQLRQLLNQSGAIMWAWQSDTHGVHVRDNWLRETRTWLERIDEIDSIAQQHHLDDRQRDALLLGVDALPAPMQELYRSTIPLTISASIGAHAAQDCVVVMGLSEHVAPRATFGFQLLNEHDLCAVFHAAVRPVLPFLTDPNAWQAREQRRFASLIASHAQQVVLSFAHYGVNGQAQLATPYVAPLLHGLADFDRDGHVVVHNPAVSCVATLPIPQAIPTTQHATQPLQLLTNNAFSASQISTYLQCPRRYYYEKVIQLGHDDESEVDERNLDMGALAHEVLCAVMGNGATENVDLRSESLEAFRHRFAVMPQRIDQVLHAAWQGTTITLTGGGTYHASQAWHQRFGTGLRLRSNWLRIEGMLQRWWEYERALYDTHPNRRPLLLEHQLDYVLDGMRIVGRIDRIDVVHLGSTMRYEIIDYKSGKPKPYSELLYGFVSRPDKELSNFQIPIYLLGLNQVNWQLTPPADVLTLFYLGKSSDKNGQLRSVYVTNHETNFVKSGNSHIGLNLNVNDLYGPIQHDLVALMKRMRYAPYPTKPSRFCSYCAFTQICDDAE